MIGDLLLLLKYLLYILPFLLFAWLNVKCNLNKKIRSRQFLMPVAAFIYCIVLLVFLAKINDVVISWINALPAFITRIGASVSSLLSGLLAPVGSLISSLAGALEQLIRSANIPFLLLFICNAGFMLAHLLLKTVLINLMKVCFKPENKLHQAAAKLFYELDPQSGIWFVKPGLGQCRVFLRTAYYASLIISAVTVVATCFLYQKQLLTALFYPVFGVILLGECVFFIDGMLKQEAEDILEAEEDESECIADYSLLRTALRKLFKDKLGAEDTTVSREPEQEQTKDELLGNLENSTDDDEEAYGTFMRRWFRKNAVIDGNYLASGRELLKGKSILFNNPFHYDLIPYVSYVINHTLLHHKKVLIVLGRHGAEADAANWVEEGNLAVTNVPEMWKIGKLSELQQDLDVGIVTRSDVHNLQLHEASAAFFDKVEFVILMEPSRLVTTAQVGLNSIIRSCRRKNEKKLVFCSTDKNCDGLVDALSHILMTNICEVSATNRHSGTSSYMCWDADGDHLQHRLLPNLSRYLGVGTELSFAALKNQVSVAEWYGGDAFPVKDMHWIAKQYYYDLLECAGLPTTQETMDSHFRVQSNLWSAKVEKHHFMTVEDEGFNMFEVRRMFATRALEQGFVNVLSSDYLLRDYMEQNNTLFNADPKAIPYIVADYAHTARNVLLRLCLRMSVGTVSEEDIHRELVLIDAPTDNLRESAWHQLCLHCCSKGSVKNGEHGEVLTVLCDGINVEFDSSVLQSKRRYSIKSGRMEELFYITDYRFIRAVLGDLQSAGYIAEDEKGEGGYLGTELLGHVFQKYLPGQFFTFNGKYYEMSKVTSEGKVLVRRAADHINGRPAYRQVRNYRISNVEDAAGMGDRMQIGEMKLTMQYADVSVDTPAYWQLPEYRDFEHGKEVLINGIPKRVYRRKQILRIDLPENSDVCIEKVCNTVAVLLNELFRTLFAENHPFISALVPGEAAIPSTYSLEIEGDESPKQCIYVIEDSQLDLGLLVAVRRNLDRIFSILCDYLDWHEETLEESLNPPPEPAPPPEYAAPPEVEETQPKTAMGRLFRKIRNAIKWLVEKIAAFFRKLFGRKPKEEPTEENVPQDAEGVVQEEGAASAGVPEEDNIHAVQLEPEETGADMGDDDPVSEGGHPLEEDHSIEEETNREEDDAQPAAGETENSSGTDDAVHMSFSLTDGQTAAEEECAVEDSLEFEPEKTVKPGGLKERAPYHERYYLLFGGNTLPDSIDPQETSAYLKTLGYDNGALKQARSSRSIAEMIEENFVPNKAGVHYCDFCGAELIGTEFEILVDGRERCRACGRSALKTAAEFVSLYHEIVSDLEAFYHIRITAPVNVKMVNSKTLHKKLGKAFVPTGGKDGRVLGVAIKDRSGYSILVENGAPKLKAAMTMVHELTHIWQYLNWDGKAIEKRYGKAMEAEVYEGMAKWSEIQYAYLRNETAAAKREEIMTRTRDDEYGRGFNKYVIRYPLTVSGGLKHGTPFEDISKPL